MSDEYKAQITPVPTIDSGTLLWGWKAELVDNSDDQKYDFAQGGQYETAAEALTAGTKALRAYVASFSEVSVYAVDLYGPEPVEETPETEEEKPETEEKPAEETPTEEKPGTETAAE